MELDLLTNVSDLSPEETYAAVRELVQLNLVDESNNGTTLTFPQIHLRDAVYNAIPERRRMELHHRIAGALEPLAENETVTLEEGPQCGHHLWLALRMKNLAQSGTITTLSATQPGTSVAVPPTAFPYTWGPSDGGACDLVGLRFQLDVGGAAASAFLGKPLDVKVELKDKAGHTATATRHVNVASTMKVIPGRNCGSSPSG
jgi:hypothetical protein